mgnify:FL=1
MELNKYKANIYTYFTILSFPRPGIHIIPQQPPFPHYTSLAPTLPKPHYPTRFSYGERLCVLSWLCIRTILLAFRRGGVSAPPVAS